ncbi:CDP-alcohol phosphatidyltransferase family protein [Actinosynnema sp. CS-041913]|uniref:CDP-alcohol phosphatidyltransferase family protein n=1 Tax=Actinosynnema sp. CS-041913 TaxID=3239917 RepID=UPI003D93D5E9
MITLQHNTAPAVPEQAAWAGLQVVLLCLLGGTVGLGPPGWLVGLAYGFGTWVLLSAAMVRFRVRALGPADRVTLGRGVLVGGVTALVVDGAGTTVLVVLASVALALDFVDGRVARRTGTTSPLGARFDMEVDAFLILVLSVHVAGTFGPWVLAIGAMRYAFVAASAVAPWLRGELPPSFARKAVAAVQGVLLVAAASGIVPFADVFVGLALAALVWSFGRDVRRLRRSRVPVATAATPVKGCSRV